MGLGIALVVCTILVLAVFSTSFLKVTLFLGGICAAFVVSCFAVALYLECSSDSRTAYENAAAASGKLFGNGWITEDDDLYATSYGPHTGGGVAVKGEQEWIAHRIRVKVLAKEQVYVWGENGGYSYFVERQDGKQGWVDAVALDANPIVVPPRTLGKEDSHGKTTVQNRQAAAASSNAPFTVDPSQVLAQQ